MGGGRQIVVTHGDPAGIGPDVMAAAIREVAAENTNMRFVLAGDARVWKRIDQRVSILDIPNVTMDATQITNTSSLVLPERGEPTVAGARLALASLDQAAGMIEERSAQAVVTGPIAKAWMSQVGFGYPGHTEYMVDIAKRMGTQDDYAMFFRGSSLDTVLVTIHEPLASALTMLSSELVERTIRLVHKEAPRYGLPVDPLVWVAGINPHAGEEGLLGGQEKEWLTPLIQRLSHESMQVVGPFPPDTMYAMAQRADSPPDILVAHYHDQGLIPFKLVNFDNGVNITLGLPFVRTSPDHGTAFDLARTPELINAQSATNALRIAAGAIAA